MASGDKVYSNPHSKSWVLTDAAVAVEDGVWVDVGNYEDLSLDIVIDTTATVEIRGSNNSTQPLNTVHERLLGSAVTSSELNTPVPQPRWIKARVTAWTAGDVNVWLVARTSQRQ